MIYQIIFQIFYSKAHLTVFFTILFCLLKNKEIPGRYPFSVREISSRSPPLLRQILSGKLRRDRRILYHSRRYMEGRLFFLSPYHPVHNPGITLNNTNHFCAYIGISVVRNRCPLRSVPIQLHCKFDSLQQSFF